MKATARFQFKLVTKENRSLVLSWLREPHVAEWFYGQGLDNTLKELDAFLNDSSIFQYWLGFDQNHPFALLISSFIEKPIDELTRWCSDDGAAITLDMLIGDLTYLGKGISHILIQNFIVNQFAHVEEVLIDPDATNLRAIHVYKKAGFKVIGEFIPSHNTNLHCMMRLKTNELI